MLRRSHNYVTLLCGQLTIKIYSYLNINIHSYRTAQCVGRYNVSDESEYVSSAHSPVQLHSNVIKPWALDTYSAILVQLYAVVSIEHLRKLIAIFAKYFEKKCFEMKAHWS